MNLVMILSLEGNIGAGKTTFLSALAERYPEYHIVLEPIDEWTKQYDGSSILELFYSDKARWAFTFQAFVLQTLVAAVKKVIHSPCTVSPSQKRIIITERSALTSRYVFAQMLKDAGCITELEWCLYLRIFDEWAMPLSGIIYLNTDPETSAKRIEKRGRHGETVSMEYLEELDRRHRAWINTTDLPVLQISDLSDIQCVNVFISSLE
jgi:deoxyadenosine/deoxycytidine kinase